MDPNHKYVFHIALEDNLFQEFNLLLKNAEDFWNLKSRVQNLHNGDANKKNFTFLQFIVEEKIAFSDLMTL